MATLINGPLGIFSGRVGNLIGCNYRGKQVLKTIPKKSTKPPTIAQQAQRMRIALAMQFLSPLKSIIGKGYGNSSCQKTPFAQCMAYHTKHAIIGTFPDLDIDYGKIVLTTGKLCRVDNPEMLSNRKACIDFSWTVDARPGMCYETDQAILVVYNSSQHRYEFRRTNSNRIDQCATLEVPLGFSGHRVHCWIIFISANGKEFSTSEYLGTVTVA